MPIATTMVDGEYQTQFEGGDFEIEGVWYELDPTWYRGNNTLELISMPSVDQGPQMVQYIYMTQTIVN